MHGAEAEKANKHLLREYALMTALVKSIKCDSGSNENKIWTAIALLS
jgi:hypothetical protein